jgi:hypothetical protein
VAAGKSAIVVHSIQEEHLYVLLQRCACGQAFELVSQTLENEGGRQVDRVTGRCSGCGRSQDFFFDVTGFFGDRERYGSLQVNPTSEPSRAIDLEGWTKLGLFYLNMVPQAQEGPERIQTSYMAAQCIEEALKLFPPGKERPETDAFFNSDDGARRDSLCNQETFRVAYLRELRRPLPPTESLREEVRKMAAKEEKGRPHE